jgi:hypothetical protein
MVLRDITRSEMASRKLAAGVQWTVALTDSTPLKCVHEQIFSADRDLFDMGRKVQELLGPVMDYIHRFEPNQPMLSFVSGAWDALLLHVDHFLADNPELARGQQTSESAGRAPQPPL